MTIRRRREHRPRLLVFAPLNVAAPSIAELVFEDLRPRAWLRIAMGVGAAVVVYGALAWWTVRRPARRLIVAAPTPELAVELFEPPPPARSLPPEPAMPRPRVASRPVPSPAPSPLAAQQPPAPAEAAEVVAREATPEDPLDLTAFSIATGNAARFAGGNTSATGTSTQAVTGAVTGGQGPPSPSAAAPARDLSRPVGISDTEWRDCAWPLEADALGIDEKVVSMRAMARADGAFESAEVLDDPGHGFGAALLSCARRHGFVPALDRQGRPVRARSGIIRFTFTR